tara:strand:- start:181 stop:411 length:231 start_codon:yes stop_codon:yes gene_type:complete
MNNKIKTTVALIFLLASGSVALSDTLYNPYSNSWELGNSSETLQYNAYENTWSYEPQGSTLEYNPYENSWGYVDGY